MTHEMRRRAKAVNFGIVYGISAFSLSQDIGVTVAEAKAYMEAYFATFPGVRKYMDDVVAQAKERGYVETLFHRRRDLPEIKSSNFNMRSFGERVALNMPIQGTAADIMKLAMVAVEKRLKRELPEAKLVLQVPGAAGRGCGKAAGGGNGAGGPPVRPPDGGGPLGPQLAGSQGIRSNIRWKRKICMSASCL